MSVISASEIYLIHALNIFHSLLIISIIIMIFVFGYAIIKKNTALIMNKYLLTAFASMLFATIFIPSGDCYKEMLEAQYAKPVTMSQMHREIEDLNIRIHMLEEQKSQSQNTRMQIVGGE
jgi:hypothetical protein